MLSHLSLVCKRTTEDDKHPGSDHPQCQHRKVRLGVYVLEKADQFSETAQDHNIVTTIYTDQSVNRTLPSAGNNETFLPFAVYVGHI